LITRGSSKKTPLHCAQKTSGGIVRGTFLTAGSKKVSIQNNAISREPGGAINSIQNIGTKGEEDRETSSGRKNVRLEK